MNRLAPVLAAAAAAGCSLIDAAGDPPPRPDAGCVAPPCFPIVAEFPTSPQRDLDLLFVIDKSPNMLGEQQALATGFSQIVRELNELEGGLPNLHIGVISSDVSFGPEPIPGCETKDDDGLLQSTPRGACAGPDGSFIIDTDVDGDGVRERNFPGTLEEVFACIAPLGGDGCGFEQPLEAIARALDGSNPENAGFLRANAFLAMAVLTSEDDCSASDLAVFSQNEDVVGPFGSFRCARWGVRCDGLELTAPGSYSNCAPWEDSPYLHPPSRYLDHLAMIKSPSMTGFALIAGPNVPFAVMASGVDDLLVSPSCSSATGEGAPSVRLHALLDGFPGRSAFSPVCNGDLAAASDLLSSLIASIVGESCLAGYILDVSADPGLQPVCRVYDVSDFHGPTEVWNEIQSCADEPSLRPCYQLVLDEDTCPFAPGHLRLIVDRGFTMPAEGATVVVTCLQP